jgi:hypothetical protein
LAAAKLIVFIVIIIGQVRILGYRVLMPIALADTLPGWLRKGLYRPLWSGRILAEAQTATEEIHPGMDAGKRFAQMREAFNDAMVTGWQELEPGVLLPDEDDRHVGGGSGAGHHHRDRQGLPRRRARTARAGGSAPRRFPARPTRPQPPTILQVIRDQAARTRRPPLTPRDLATLLGRAGVPGFADEILRLMGNPLDGT